VDKKATLSKLDGMKFSQHIFVIKDGDAV